ncbi:hypothetical protein [Arthrobacter sp. UYCo732]|uniref:hypothetical protein n=1 Tax=Arthrobacter sp. UYCo732 TaxID=3156336 RepID=UPI003390CEEB
MKTIPLTATKTIEAFLDSAQASGTLAIELKTLKASAQRANAIARKLGVAGDDPRRIVVGIDPHRLPNSSKWRRSAAWARIVREGGKWALEAFGTAPAKRTSYGAGGTDHVYITATDDEELLLANRRKAKIRHQTTHIKTS